MSRLLASKWSVALILLAILWWLPWWFFVLSWFLAVLLIPNFYQAIIPALFFDLTNVSGQLGPWRVSLPLTLLALLLLWVARGLQRYLRL